MQWYITCPHLQTMGPMATGPLSPANGWESTDQVLFCIRGDSLLCRVKLLKKKGKDCHPKKNVSTLVISVLTTPGSISWINTPVPSISKARDWKISSMNEKKRTLELSERVPKLNKKKLMNRGGHFSPQWMSACSAWWRCTRPGRVRDKNFPSRQCWSLHPCPWPPWRAEAGGK